MRNTARPIRFSFNKTSFDDEVLTLTVYRNDGEVHRAQVSAEIIPNEALSLNQTNPLDSWTIRKREYDLQALPLAPSVLIDRPGSLDAGSRCFIKLGSDLPPGNYDIVVQTKDNTRGFIRLHQTVLGELPVRRVQVADHLSLIHI